MSMIKQRILLVTRHDIKGIGGVESTLRLMSSELSSLGHEVAIMYFERGGEGLRSYQLEGIHYFAVPVLSSKVPRILFRNYAEAAREAFNIVSKSFEPDQIWSRYAVATYGIISCTEFKRLNIKIKQIFPATAGFQKMANFKNIITYPLWKRPKLYILGYLYFLENKKVEKFVLKSPSIIPIVFSINMYKKIVEESGISEDRIRLIRPGVDVNRFNGHPSQDELIEMREILPHLPERFVLFVGRLEANKNVDILIKAISRIEDINLVIVGDGAMRENLNLLTIKMNLSSRVLFVGRQDKLLKALYTEADFTILPSEIEPFGMVLLESLACGTPVVAFGGENIHTAATEIIKDETNGIIVKSFTINALCEAIREMRDKVILNRTAKADINRAYVEQHWNQKNMILEILTI